MSKNREEYVLTFKEATDQIVEVEGHLFEFEVTDVDSKLQKRRYKKYPFEEDMLIKFGEELDIIRCSLDDDVDDETLDEKAGPAIQAIYEVIFQSRVIPYLSDYIEVEESNGEDSEE